MAIFSDERRAISPSLVPNTTTIYHTVYTNNANGANAPEKPPAYANKGLAACPTARKQPRNSARRRLGNTTRVGFCCYDVVLLCWLGYWFCIDMWVLVMVCIKFLFGEIFFHSPENFGFGIWFEKKMKKSLLKIWSV